MGSAITFQIQDFITLFLGLVIEAFPFLILGVFISAIVAVFVKDKWIIRIVPKNVILSHFVLSLVGILLPVCECGNVPLVRRLLAKGFTVSQSTTFLLAAPIVNPITFFATLSAFSLDPSIAWVRLFGALAIANGIGLLISLKKNQTELLNQKFYYDECLVHEGGSHNHSHHSDHDHSHSLDEKTNVPLNENLTKFVSIFRSEFMAVMPMLCLGGFIAAMSQTLIPRDIVTSIGSNPVLSVLAMIFLAFVISICANVDAFFALSYANTFTAGAIISFLVFGPMIDIKILTMLKTTFKLRYLALISVLVFLMSFSLGLAVNILF